MPVCEVQRFGKPVVVDDIDRADEESWIQLQD
jgi:hypothetical protein